MWSTVLAWKSRMMTSRTWSRFEKSNSFSVLSFMMKNNNICNIRIEQTMTAKKLLNENTFETAQKHVQTVLAKTHQDNCRLRTRTGTGISTMWSLWDWWGAKTSLTEKVDHRHILWRRCAARRWISYWWNMQSYGIFSHFYRLPTKMGMEKSTTWNLQGSWGAKVKMEDLCKNLFHLLFFCHISQLQ